jgi:hypothetical protein
MKGEARFEAAGQAWVLTFSFNELVSLEEELGVKVAELGEKLGDSARTVRTVFRICLEAQHGKMTDAAAGDLISEVGPQEAALLIGKAFTAAFPKGSGGADPRRPVGAPAPKKKARGTGTGA